MEPNGDESKQKIFLGAANRSWQHSQKRDSSIHAPNSMVSLQKAKKILENIIRQVAKIDSRRLLRRCIQRIRRAHIPASSLHAVGPHHWLNISQRHPMTFSWRGESSDSGPQRITCLHIVI
jgi:hypothetical protein